MNDMSLTAHRPAPLPARQRRPVAWDSTLDWLGDPYRFIGRTCDALGSDVFETRLLLRPTLCMSGPRAARLFYDDELFQRSGAAPEPLRATLFGKGAVQALDGSRHRQRKAFFVAATAPARVAALVQQSRLAWEGVLPDWARGGPLSLYRALQPVLTRSVCAWAGVPLPAADLARRTGQLVAMFDSAAAGPWQHLRARWARWRAEAWLAQLVSAEREGRLALPVGSAAHAVAWQREADGTLLPPRMAAVELINLLRPVVAVSLYMSFVAHALHTCAGERERLLASSAPGDRLAFVQEVRRHYPFFPAVMARVRHDFEWGGAVFRRGQRAVLDLYGTNHDARLWDEPWQFRPQRFSGRQPGAFELVPQGGGEVATQHRCPREDVALQLMLLALEMLLRGIRYEVPQQRLGLLMDRLPAVPHDGMLLRVAGQTARIAA